MSALFSSLSFSAHHLSYLLSKQQISLWFCSLPRRISLPQADVSRFAATLWPVRVLLFLFVGEAVTRPLWPGTVWPPISTCWRAARPPDDDRWRAVCQEDVCVVLCLLWIAEQEAVTGAQGIKGGLRGGAALRLHPYRDRKKAQRLGWRKETQVWLKGTLKTNTSEVRGSSVLSIWQYSIFLPHYQKL